jgi:hypothetical protein
MKLSVPEFIDPVFRENKPKTLVFEVVCVNRNSFNPIINVKKGNFQGTVSYETIRARIYRPRFGLVFAKTRSINSGTGAAIRIFGYVEPELKYFQNRNT